MPLTELSYQGYHGRMVPRKTGRGCILYHWEEPTPRIPRLILDCVIYLYPSVQDAMDGVQSGGTGVLVSVDEALNGGGYCRHVYAVTCSHVLHGNPSKGAPPSPVVRLNNTSGKKEAINLTESDWFDHPNGEDLAMCLLPGMRNEIRFRSVSDRYILQELYAGLGHADIGDEVFMLSRFGPLEGKEGNMPFVRFGNISAVPGDPIHQIDRNYDQSSYVVEMRSLSGLSGSPVFLYQPYVSVEDIKTELDKSRSAEDESPWLVQLKMCTPVLLGINWGSLNINCEPIKDPGGALIGTVRGNSGFGCIVPGWKLFEMLHSKDVKMTRMRATANIVKARAEENDQSPATMDFMSSEPAEGDPQAAFEDNLSRILSLPKDKIEEYGREHKPFGKAKRENP